jgi:4-hydroxy-3-methylbut-2-en-1-yl diphosphate synthase IspG/GcpE
MSKLTPKYVTCPACGRMLTNHGYHNHVNECRAMSPIERETTKRIRDMNK